MRIDSSHPARRPFYLQSAHVIRLRGPWHWETRAASEQPAARQQASDRRPATFQAPDGLATILSTTPAGRLRLSRLFRCPTGLDAESSVALVIEPTAARGVVRLNSVSLGPLQPGISRYWITSHLRATNELQMDLDLDLAATTGQPPAAPRIDVRLEIA